MNREKAKTIVKGITDKIEATTDIDDWAEFWGFTREDYEEFLEMPIKALEQEPCEDAISRQWIKTAIHNFYDGLMHTPTEEDIQAYLSSAPSVHPKAKPGKWVDSQRSIFGVIVKCDQCGNFLGLNAVNGGRGDANYCPNCGAKMESED